MGSSMKILSSTGRVSRQDQERSEQALLKVFEKPDPLIDSLLFQLDHGPSQLQSLDAVKKQYSRFAVVGIGGSSLGIQVLTQFFSNSQFTYFDNVDAVEFESQMRSLGSLDEVFWLFISKSGETIETLAVLEFVNQIYSENKKNLAKQCLVITEKKQNSLNEWAKNRDVQQFEIPQTVGGRFSVLSHVGLVPAYLMGLNIQALNRGARKAIESKKDLTSFTAEVLSSFNREEWITVLWNYSSRLRNFGLWWQQLWAESLAKKENLEKSPAPRVSTPYSLVGATDQHSVLQQINEGFGDKFVLFLRFAAAEKGSYSLEKAHTQPTQILQSLRLGDLLQAEAIATQQSLTESGVSNMTLQIENFDEENLGYLLMFMQISILALGKALNINPLNQPGVERGKILCKKILMKTHNL